MNMNRSRGFTLLEILVVISIIAILAGMVIPVYYSAKNRARETKARVAVKALETAFKSYLDTYKLWPNEFVNGEVKNDIFKALRGDASSCNLQAIPFYEFETVTNSSMDAATAYDPWSNPNDNSTWAAYQVMFDRTYANKIDVAGDPVYRGVIVWSVGENRVNEYGQGDDVASWR